jgi:hypothetical protein
LRIFSAAGVKRSALVEASLKSTTLSILMSLAPESAMEDCYLMRAFGDSAGRLYHALLNKMHDSASFCLFLSNILEIHTALV